MIRLSRRSLAAGLVIPLTSRLVGAQDDDLEAELHQLVDQRRDIARAPGTAVIASNGEREIQVFSGLRNQDTSEPVSADTQFHVASLVKPITAQALRDVLDEAGIDQSTTVQSILPEFQVADAEASSAITIQHLLTHTTGLVPTSSYNGVETEDAVEDYVQQLSDYQQITNPGGPFGYQNVHAILAARLIEVLTEAPYDQAMQQRVFNPLKLGSAGWSPNTNYATGHFRGQETDQDLEIWPRAGWAAGGLWISPADLIRIGHDMQSRLSTEGQAPGGSMSNLEADHLGNFWFTTGDLHWHTGRTPGSHSLLMLHPESGLVIAVLTNDYFGAYVNIPVARWLLNRLIDNHDLDARQSDLVDVSVFPDYYGVFASPDSGEISVEPAFSSDGPAKISVTTSGAEQPILLDWMKRDQFFTEEEELQTLIDFVRDDSGVVTWVRNGGKLLRRKS